MSKWDKLVVAASVVIAVIVVTLAVWLPIRVLQLSTTNHNDLETIHTLTMDNHSLEQQLVTLSKENGELLHKLCVVTGVKCPAK